MPVDMPKLTIIVPLAVIVIALAVGLCFFLLGGDTTESPSGDSYFTIAGISGLQYFKGERVIVQAVIINNVPATDTPAPAETSDGRTVSASSAAVKGPVSSYDEHKVVAELEGDQSAPVIRSQYVSLASNERRVITFDFGPVPAGSYTVTVMVPDNDESTASASVLVKPTPLINEWTSIGDVAFLLDNLRHDSVDVNIRNSGQHAVIFGDLQYNIFLNCSDSCGVVLQGLDQTLVMSGETVTVHAKIPIAGRYYLDYFAIAVKIPWEVWMTATV
jgi:hypothetical protein